MGGHRNRHRCNPRARRPVPWGLFAIGESLAVLAVFDAAVEQPTTAGPEVEPA